MKNLVVLVFALVSGLSFAQSVSDYKYAIVPAKFDFLSEPDQFKMNTYTKMFLEKYGFVVFFDTDVLPDELVNQNCNRLFVDVLDDSGLMNTKLTVVLKDCRNTVLFTSAEGKSREKAFKVAYVQALREAFKSFDTLEYKYNGTVTSVQKATVTTVNDGTKITSSVTPVQVSAPVIVTPIPDNSADVLFAQPIENGYQIIDKTPKVVLKLKNTSAPGIFLAERDQLKGTLFAKDGKWIFEYYSDGKLISEPLNIKF